VVGVEAGDRQVVAHVGLHALGRLADRLGLGARLSEQVGWAGERAPVHDRGTVLVQAMLMLAGGGESCADIEHLRVQARLFGAVASDSTLYRTITALDPGTLGRLGVAMAETRAQVWSRTATTTGTAPVVLDIDASLIEGARGTRGIPQESRGLRSPITGQCRLRRKQPETAARAARPS
jgi:Transposase DDE domain group 1